MKKIIVLIALIALTAFATTAQTITNVRFEQVGKQLVITYNLDAPTSSQWQISVSASTDNGTTWGNNLSSVTGDVGKEIKPGNDKKITWDVLSERSSLTGTIRFKVKAESNTFGDIEMVFVQGGTFEMGSNNVYSSEKPVHSVTLSDFYIGKTEVTQKQWRDIMGSNPSYFKNCDNCPVEQVSWEDVQGFIQKLNQKTGNTYRLPTEAEWEFAAKGGNKSKGYDYSGSNSLSDVAWFDDNSGSETHPVAQLQPNELGIYDMSGNVWEWCSDWYGGYSGFDQTNPKGPSTRPPWAGRVGRGGSWNRLAVGCRPVYRSHESPGFRYSHIGFRLASH